METSKGALAFGYDDLLRQTTKLSDQFRETYTYTTQAGNANQTSTKFAQIAYTGVTSYFTNTTLGYTYDALGNIKTVTRDDVTTEYSYDNQGQQRARIRTHMIPMGTSGRRRYIRVRPRQGIWKVVTGPMSFEDSIAWVTTNAYAGTYGKNASWGLYTDNQSDALLMATILGGGMVPESHFGITGQYSHYHVNGFILFDKYKHFHIWYGVLN